MDNRLYRSLNKETVQEVYSICKANMEDLYNACSWKWNEKKECLHSCRPSLIVTAMRSRANRFLIIRCAESNAIAAYIMLRFFIDPDDDASVVYMCPRVGICKQ